MKNLTSTTHGRSCTVDHSRPSSTLDGGSEPGIPAREQETSAGSFGPSGAVCWRSERDRVWDEVGYLLDSLGRIKATLTDGTDWDPDEVKWINERYWLCRRQALDYILCLNVSEVLRTVSFPGEHLTYLEVAKRVIIDCTEWELREAIREIGLNPNQRVYYKVRADVVSVERAEGILIEMLADGNYVLAGEFLNALELSAKSATYTALKRELVEKGWKWKSKKVSRRVVKVVCR
jgi:hypothetical protein